MSLFIFFIFAFFFDRGGRIVSSREMRRRSPFVSLCMRIPQCIPQIYFNWHIALPSTNTVCIDCFTSTMASRMQSDSPSMRGIAAARSLLIVRSPSELPHHTVKPPYPLLAEFHGDDDDNLDDEERADIPFGAHGGSTQTIAAPDLHVSTKPQVTIFNRIKFEYASTNIHLEHSLVAEMLIDALQVRKSFVYQQKPNHTLYEPNEYPQFHSPADDISVPHKSMHAYEWREGIFAVTNTADESKNYTVPSVDQFGEALHLLLDIANSGPCKTYCYTRLQLLEARFNVHMLMNAELENRAQRAVPKRDLYNVRKVDNHVHHSACMNQKHLLRFIRSKLRKEPDTEVIVRDGTVLTLAQVFESLHLSAEDLNVNSLETHADETYQRFDRFNSKYSPFKESRLREIFLKYSNHINGRYLAEITHEVFSDLADTKYQLAEYRVSIYGTSKYEWSHLARWVVDNRLFHPNVLWMIQIPRLYRTYKAAGKIECFGDMLRNIFEPLFAITIDPELDPKLHQFLKHCVGFDLVDDESLREQPYHESMPDPDGWKFPYDPPYSLFLYYTYANLMSLNKLREERGFSTFDLRPHSGEAGDFEHLAASFILARGINHGLVLHRSPPLQYLFYLAQVGISLSPLSNNLLFLAFEKNPFKKYFVRGLNVALSTDDPLMIHVTKEPLVEEYAIASQVWKLNAVDMCEIARNSVLQSGFPHQFKAYWIGNGYWHREVHANDIAKTNVPDIRQAFRIELLEEEHTTVSLHAGKSLDLSLIDSLR